MIRGEQVTIEMIEDTELCAIGNIINTDKKSAENYVNLGMARYVSPVEEHKHPNGCFSLYHDGILNVTPSTELTLEEVVEMIKEGDELIEAIRKETDKDRKDNMKKKLSYVTFGGTFTTRGKKNLITASGYASFDLDHLPNLDEIKKKLSENKFVSLVFVSPSGDGLKVVVKIPRVVDDEEYKKYWLSIAKHLNIEEQDEACKDISRACFLSVDKEPYFNPDSEVYTEQVKYEVVNQERTQELTEEDEKIISSIKDKWIDGDRQNLAMSLAGYLRKEKKYGFDRTASIIRAICEEKGDLAVTERLNVVQQTYLKDEGEVKGISGLVEREVKLEETNVNDFLKVEYKENGEEKPGKKIKIDAVADYLIAQNSFSTIFTNRNEYMYNFDGKIYKQEAKGIIKTGVEKLLRNYAKTNNVNEVLEKIKRKTDIPADTFDKVDVNLIPLENKVYNIKSKGTEDYLPSHYFRTFIPHEIIEGAECPNWKKFLSEALYEEDIAVAQEWFGFCLFRKYFVKKAVICVGEQDTGKSVFLDTLIDFVGEMNKTGISLQKITSGSDFTKLALKDKLVNAFDDLSSKDLNDGGAFKVATGGGYISGEEKFGEFTQFKSHAKQIFATNKIPPVKDSDDLAYFGRWIILRFDNVPEKLDPFLREKLTTKEEMSGIVNWALEGLHRLLENGKFSYNKEPKEIKKIMEISGDPLIQFGAEVLEQSDGKVTKEEMYQVYCIWANEYDKPLLTKSQLGHQLHRKVKYLIPGTESLRVWKNVKIKQEWFEKFAQDKNIDTLDTFEKNICLEKKEVKMSNKNSNMSFSDASFPSKKNSEEEVSKVSNFTKEELELAGISKEDYVELKNE